MARPRLLNKLFKSTIRFGDSLTFHCPTLGWFWREARYNFSRQGISNPVKHTTRARFAWEPRWSAVTVLAALGGGPLLGFACQGDQCADQFVGDCQSLGERNFFNPYERYANATARQQAIAELRDVLGNDAVETDTDICEERGRSGWSTCNSETVPDVVVWPKSTKDVQEIVKIANQHRLPLVPICGKSSLEGNFSATYGGICIDFRELNQILAFYPDDMQAVVQPGVSWRDFNEQIADSGLFFPVDPGPSAQFGGMAGTRCSGTNAVRYGTMRDWVVNLKYVSMDNAIIQTRNRSVKSSAGLDLTGLLIGSEGTLGITTAITIKLAPRPEHIRVGVVTFPSIRKACEATVAVKRHGIDVQCIELLDDVQMGVINSAMRGTNVKSRIWNEKDTLFIKFSGTENHIKDDIERAIPIFKRFGGQHLEFAQDEKEADELWDARKNSLWAMEQLRNEGDVVWSTDCAVPISRLPDIIEWSKAEMDRLGLFASILGHVGDGNFHSSIMYNPNDEDQRRRVSLFVESMVQKALEMEGTCTGEHGVGMGKKKALVKELGQDNLDIQRALKRVMDPQWICNPGKIWEPTRTHSIEDHTSQDFK